VPTRLFVAVLPVLVAASAAHAAGLRSDDRTARLLAARASDVPAYWGKDYVLPEAQCVPTPALPSALANSAFGSPHQKLVSVVTVLKTRTQADVLYTSVARRIGACLRRILKRNVDFVSPAERFRFSGYGQRSTAARVRFSYRQNPRNREDWVVIRSGRAVLVDIAEVCCLNNHWKERDGSAPLIRRVVANAFRRLRSSSG
jgi:hypothetical protein